MRPRILLIALLTSLPTVAADEQRYVEINKQVQEKLRAEGLYSGPISGEFGFNTQAALAQFQLSRALPASGSLDDTTLAALGLKPFAESPAQADAASPSVEQQSGTIEASVQSGNGASAPAR